MGHCALVWCDLFGLSSLLCDALGLAFFEGCHALGVIVMFLSNLMVLALLSLFTVFLHFFVLRSSSTEGGTIVSLSSWSLSLFGWYVGSSSSMNSSACSPMSAI